VKTNFLCLANSRKYYQRCIAGIEANIERGGALNFVFENGEPKWIRPVYGSDYGQVPLDLVQEYNLLDLIEIEITETCPDGYKRENVRFNTNSLKKISSIANNKGLVEILDSLLNTADSNLFGNRWEKIWHSVIDDVRKSLIFIKPGNVEIAKSNTKTKRGTPQLRAKFDFNQNSYDLPITDAAFENSFMDNINLTRNMNNIYFTISLAEEWHKAHYKLIAGVVYF